jgi:DNA transformation protein
MGKKGAKATSAAASVAAEMVEALRPVGEVTSKSMFGGYGIFESGTMFALVSPEAELFFRADDQSRKRYEDAGSSQHKPMPYFEVSADVMEDDSTLIEWAEEAAQVAHAAKKK